MSRAGIMKCPYCSGCSNHRVSWNNFYHYWNCGHCGRKFKFTENEWELVLVDFSGNIRE